MIPMKRETELLLLRRLFVGDAMKRGLAVYHPLSSILATLPTGQAVNNVNTSYQEAAVYQGIPCVRFANGGGNTYITIPFSGNTDYAGWSGSVSLWIAKQGMSTSGKNKVFFTIPRAYSASASTRICIMKTGSGTLNVSGYNANGKYTHLAISSSANAVNFHHVAMNITIPPGQMVARTADVYIDGTYLDSVSTDQRTNANFQYVQVGIYNADEDSTDAGSVYFAGLRVWNRHLKATEIATLAGEFTPVAS